jgi:transcriptional regulator with XRE-family HTH domain
VGLDESHHFFNCLCPFFRSKLDSANIVPYLGLSQWIFLILGKKFMGTDFPLRLKGCIKKTGMNVEDFGKAVGVSKAQMYRYLSGENDASTAFFQAAKEVFPRMNIEWLITGIGEMEATGGTAAAGCFDAELLKQALDVVETALEETGRVMSSRKKAELVVAIYELYADSGTQVDKARVLRLIKSVA